MNTFKQIILFEKFIMPYALQILFWAGIAGTWYGAWWLYARDNWAWIMALVFGTLLTRLIFENFILRYQSYLCLTQIRDKMNEAK